MRSLIDMLCRKDIRAQSLGERQNHPISDHISLRIELTKSLKYMTCDTRLQE